MGQTYDQWPSTTEVIEPPQPGRRRQFTAEEKRRLVSEAMATGSGVSLVARRNGISASLLFRWRRLLKERELASPGDNTEVLRGSEIKQLRSRVHELERLLGKKTLEVEMLKEELELMRSKRLRLR
jgi:transposase